MTIQVYEGEGKEPPLDQRWEADSIQVSCPSPMNVEEGRMFLTGMTAETHEKFLNEFEVGSVLDVMLVTENRLGIDEDFDPKITVLLKHVDENEKGIHGTIHWITTEAARREGIEVGPDFEIPDGHCQ